MDVSPERNANGASGVDGGLGVDRSVLGLDGAEAGPGEVGDHLGDLVGIELVASLDQQAARTLGHAHERMRNGGPMAFVDVDGDQRRDCPAASAVIRVTAALNSSSRRVPEPNRNRNASWSSATQRK